MPYYKKKKAHVPYVPKLLYAQLPADSVTWGRSDKIIQLLKEDKPLAEIAALTGNRLSFVKRVVNRHLHPEEFEIPTPVEPKPEIIEAPKPVKIPKQPKQKKSHECYACGTTESTANHWYNNGEIGSLCSSCRCWLRTIQRGAKPRQPRKLSHAVLVNCKVCSKQFTACPSEIAKGRRYCSAGCYHKSRIMYSPEESKSRQRAATKKWLAKHPEKMREYNRRRRAKEALTRPA